MDVIGIDVGGTTVKAIRAAVDGTVLASDSVRTPNVPAELTGAVIALATALRGETTVAVGVVCPGIVVDGIAQFAVNVPWRDEPVRDRVRVALGLPVALEWDVAAAALAESSQVAADDVLFVSLGTGVASAHVVGGVVRRGATGRAGELGHSPIYPDGDLCACGQRGCLEAYASAAAIARRYAARSGTSLATIDIAARVGADPDAAAVWDGAVEALGIALATQTMVTDPGVIVLGGGLAEAGDLLVEPVRNALASRLAWRPAPPVLRASLGAAAGMHGAAALAWSLLGAADRPAEPLRSKGSSA